MSETWIKVRHNLVRSPRVFLLARELKCKPIAALGAMVSWLVWLDEQSEDGSTGMTPAELDGMLGVKGLAAAMVRIGWAEIQGGMVRAVDFEKHCGESAKKRADAQFRQARSRASVTKKCDGDGAERHTESVTPVTDFCDKSVTRVRVREEKNNIVAAVCDNTTVSPEATGSEPAAPAAAAAGGEFEKWREAMCRAFPTLRGAVKLSEKVEAVAMEAYGRLPGAAEKAALLAAYLDDRTPMDRYRNKFYRPVSQIKFFENLEDVLGHAELWRRETGWKADRPKPKPKEAANEEARENWTQEEMVENWNEIMQEVGGSTPGDGRMSLNEAKRILREPRKPMTPAEEAEAAAEREAILRRVKGGNG